MWMLGWKLKSHTFYHPILHWIQLSLKKIYQAKIAQLAIDKHVVRFYHVGGK